MAQKLTLADISDLREYERERAEFREHIIAIKQRRRVELGPVITLTFENRDTVRFQVQEMARAERMMRDEQIQEELDAYNPLIAAPGSLSATMFIELRTEAELREWLPKLVGIERAVQFRLGEGAASEIVACAPETSHEAQLTREDVTASVHYVFFHFSPEQMRRFADGPVTIESIHPEYGHATPLSPETSAELMTDLQDAG